MRYGPLCRRCKQSMVDILDPVHDTIEECIEAQAEAIEELFKRVEFLEPVEEE